jgi:hypothetical protein
MDKQMLFIESWTDAEGYTREKTCIVELPSNAKPTEFWEHLPHGFGKSGFASEITIYDLSMIDHIKPAPQQPILTTEQTKKEKGN